MELLAVGIEHISRAHLFRLGIFRSDHRRIGGFRGHIVGGTALITGDPISNRLPVGGEENITLQVCAQNGCAGILQAADHFIVGMPVGVIFAAGNDRILRHHIPNKLVAGGGGRAVMPHLQHR